MKSFQISSYNKIIPDAYHGTSYENALNIHKEQSFNSSLGDKHYLGDGVYFFEGSSKHAENWAKKVKNFSQIGILKAVINLGKCLDLNIPEHMGLIQRVHEKLIKQNVQYLSDGFVINATAKIVEIDTVRWSYTKPDLGTIYKGSRFFKVAQIIICVRNTKLISSIVLVKGVIK